MQALVPFMPWIGGAIALVCAFVAMRNNSRKRLIQSLPTSRSNGIFIGLVELNGVAESQAPLQSYLAGARCVHYEFKIEEHWERTTSETVTDADGKTRRESKTESGWKTVAEGGETQSFYLKDGGGAVLVHPKGARLEPKTLLSRTVGTGDPLYYGRGPSGAVDGSTQRRRFIEQGFLLHAPVFIVGKSRERRDVVAPEIAADETAELFLISSQGEEKVVSGYRMAAVLWTVAGLVGLLGMLVWWDLLHGREWTTRIRAYAGASFGYACFWIVGWVWSVYNGLITLRNRVRQGLSLVDIQLKRRHDLIPNLVRVVSGLKDHEQRVHTEVAALRAQAGATLPGMPGPDPRALKPALVGLQEAYPNLKADRAFLDLQKELVETENRIALARDYFNNIATHYNTCLEQVPDNVVAVLAAVRAQPRLEAADFERAAVKVSFAS